MSSADSTRNASDSQADIASHHEDAKFEKALIAPAVGFIIWYVLVMTVAWVRADTAIGRNVSNRVGKYVHGRMTALPPALEPGDTTTASRYSQASSMRR